MSHLQPDSGNLHLHCGLQVSGLVVMVSKEIPDSIYQPEASGCDRVKSPSTIPGVSIVDNHAFKSPFIASFFFSLTV